MKTILVPTDFSEAANNAAEYAINLAKEIKAKVILFHVYHLPTHVPEIMFLEITSPELQKESEARLRASHLKKKTGVELVYLAKMGLAVDEILAEEKNVDLIVMGMKGAGILTEILMGSVTTATLRKAKTPVLVIPENAEYKNPKVIVFACDYDSQTDIHTLDDLKDFAKNFGSKIYIVNVRQPNESAIVEDVEMKIENKLRDVEHIYYFPEEEDLVGGINEFVKDYNADMVAIIPHRYNFMDRLFHESISKKMAFHTHVPLLSLPDNHKSITTYFL